MLIYSTILCPTVTSTPVCFIQGSKVLLRVEEIWAYILQNMRAYFWIRENHEVVAYQCAESITLLWVTRRKSYCIRVPIIIIVQSTQYSITNIRRGALYNERVHLHAHSLVTQMYLQPTVQGGAEPPQSERGYGEG